MSNDSLVLEEAPERPSDGEQKRDFAAIPEDTILGAIVTSVEKIVKPFKDKETGQAIHRVEFGFKVTDDGEYLNRRVWGDTPTTFNTSDLCKLRQWVTEILAVPELEKGFTLHFSDLVNQPVRIVIALKEWTDNQSGKTKHRNFVKDVIRDREQAEANRDLFASEEEPF